MTNSHDRILQAKQELLAELHLEAFQYGKMFGRTDFSPKIYDAISTTPREEFTLEIDRPYAYLNQPLAIGYKQTISQPFIVALMTDLLETQPHHHVLEIGTGSGYQAAVLSRLVEHVYSIEIIRELATRAKEKLQNLGYSNVTVYCLDGHHGLAEYAPYDGIIVTAVTEEIPPALLQQLKPGGRMVLPIGRVYSMQNLVVVSKDLNGKISKKKILPVQFVPLTRSLD